MAFVHGNLGAVFAEIAAKIAHQGLGPHQSATGRAPAEAERAGGSGAVQSRAARVLIDLHALLRRQTGTKRRSKWLAARPKKATKPCPAPLCLLLILADQARVNDDWPPTGDSCPPSATWRQQFCRRLGLRPLNLPVGSACPSLRSSCC